jgi:hypothetical protein
MIQDFAVIDFETAYDKDFSLTKMQTDAYILDPRFEIIGVSVKPSKDAPIQWFSGTKEETKQFLKSAIDWKNTAVCCHNTLFDGFICTTLGLRPKLWMDTLGMGRALFPWLKSHSLASLAEHLGVGRKGTEVQTAIGKRRADFTPEGLAAYGEYCKNDTALTHTIATLLTPRTPAIELKIIDMVIRMFTQPRIRGDVGILQDYYEKEVARKQALMARIDADKDTIMSNPKFAQALIDLGVTPPMKVSARTGKSTYAFSKTDKEFTALLDHEDADVQALVAARLGVKTTIAETRAQTLIATANRGPLPIYLNYWGAKTTGRLCLTGDTVITVLRDALVLDILLPELRPDDLVWDGEFFVSHGGLLDQGEHEVMTYDGITGTPDHRVFCDEAPGTVGLREASERNYTITTARTPTEHAAYFADSARRSERCEE